MATHRETMGVNPEKKERRPPRFTVDTESVASTKKGTDGRNEDAVLGDVTRIDRELADPPTLGTENPEADSEAMAAAALVEKRLAKDLTDRAIFGNADGLSGKRGGGTGLMASRIGMARAAEVLSKMPAEADAKTSERALAEAITEAHKAVLDYKNGRSDLAEMSTTMDLARMIDNGDGTVDFSFAHVGDSRIYSFDPETGKLERLTEDDSIAKAMYEGGEITVEGKKMNLPKSLSKEQYDQVVNANDASELPENLKRFFKMRNIITDGVGGENARVKTGTKRMKKGAKFLMLTDGVGDNLTDKKIEEVMRAGGGMGDLVMESRAVIGSNDPRAKDDDVSGTIIETTRDVSGEHLAARPEQPAPTEKQIDAWREEADNALMEIASLRELQRAANDPSADMKRGDAERIAAAGGAEGIADRIRDLRIDSLDREISLLAAELAKRERNGGSSSDATRLERMIAEKKTLEGERKQAIQQKEARQIEQVRRGIMGASSETGRPAPEPPPTTKKKGFWQRLTGG
jgi:serine/threonine protein phosphatase PrpC